MSDILRDKAEAQKNGDGRAQRIARRRHWQGLARCMYGSNLIAIALQSTKERTQKSKTAGGEKRGNSPRLLICPTEALLLPTVWVLHLRVGHASTAMLAIVGLLLGVLAAVVAIRVIIAFPLARQRPPSPLARHTFAPFRRETLRSPLLLISHAPVFDQDALNHGLDAVRANVDVPAEAPDSIVNDLLTLVAPALEGESSDAARADGP